VAALAQVPAVWVLTGIAMALYGLAPHLSSLSWGALALFLILGQLGQILQFPQWSLDLSPFTHIPLIPAETFTATPFLALLGVVATLILAGIWGFRRRDIPA
jgi:ABC-2 type transport system permease protein